MRWSYLVKHWFSTLFIGPAIAQIMLLVDSIDNLLFGFFEYYFLFIIFGIFFSTPTYLVYSLLYWYLAKKNLDEWKAKVILIFVAITGIVMTFSAIGGSVSDYGIISYSISSLLTGIFFKLNFKNDNN